MNSVTILIKEKEFHLKGTLIISSSVRRVTIYQLWGRKKYMSVGMNKNQVNKGRV